MVLYKQQENIKFRKKYDGWIYRITEWRKQIRQTSNFTYNTRNAVYGKKERTDSLKNDTGVINYVKKIW